MSWDVVRARVEDRMEHDPLLKSLAPQIKEALAKILAKEVTDERRMKLGYGQVYFVDPSLRFSCESKTIGLTRKSGGEVQFTLMDFDQERTAKRFRTFRIKIKEQFEHLWKAIESLPPGD